MIPPELLSPPNFLSGTDLPPAPKQTRSIQKREALLQAALVLFEQQPYELTTIEAIAASAEVATGGFYLHFRSKPQLVLVLMDRLVHSIHAFEAQPLPGEAPPGIIRRILRESLQLDRQYGGAYRAWKALTHADPGLSAVNATFETWLHQRLRLLMQGLASMTPTRPGLDLDNLAWVLTLLFLELIDRLTDDNLDRILDTLARVFIHTMFTDHDQTS